MKDIWNEERVQQAEDRLKNQGKECVNKFWKNQYEDHAGRYWNEFYKRNKCNFYKDRHYLHIVFPELDPSNKWFPMSRTCLDRDGEDVDSRMLHLVEIGCGVGNALLPLIQLNPRLIVHALDFAKSAISLLRQHPLVLSSGGRVLADVCDVVNQSLPDHVAERSMDLVLCMFVLSAIPPQVINHSSYIITHETLMLPSVSHHVVPYRTVTVHEEIVRRDSKASTGAETGRQDPHTRLREVGGWVDTYSIVRLSRNWLARALLILCMHCTLR